MRENVGMEIKGKVHCLFEQSGTFKNEFKKLGIDACDYDILNHFGETDFVIDLFGEIEKGWAGEKSIFDAMTKDDLLLAFFPCTYFTGSVNPRYFTLENKNYRKMTTAEKINRMLARSDARQEYYKTLLKFCGIALTRGLRLVFENPYSALHYLNNNFLCPPAVFDKDRTERGDVFVKPTGYWFIGCEPASAGGGLTAPKRQ